MKHAKLHVCISLDVEEEGLFSGQYRTRNVSTRNVAWLPRLEPIASQFGLPLTLFCSHAVFSDPQARSVLEKMRKICRAEIGAHLHHWSTPPWRDDEDGTPERTHLMDRRLLLERLQTLLTEAADFLGHPATSFRMGRWDLKAALLPELAQMGINVDSSVCPLRAFANGPDHFLAPADPYFIKFPSGGQILEAPLTQLPISRHFARLWRSLLKNRQKYLDAFHFFGALSANPLWHSDAVMRMAALSHALRGGRILNLFWHSSEMYPGGSPHIPDQAASEALLKRIFSFCGWLREHFEIQGVTASQLPDLPEAKNFPVRPLEAGRDW